MNEISRILPLGSLSLADKLLNPITRLYEREARPLRSHLPPVTSLRAFRHSHTNAVLASFDNSYTLTNGFVSYSVDNNPNWMLQLHEDFQTLGIQRLYVVDLESRNQWRSFQNHVTATNHIQEILLLPSELTPFSPCKRCLRVKCHRWAAIFEMRRLLNNYPIDQIPHA